MKKNKVNSKISFTKSVIADLNKVDVHKIIGGVTLGCQLSYDRSCFSPCGSSDATYGCDNDL